MSNIEQMEDNISYMKDFNGLTEKEKETLNKVREELNKIDIIPCTTCNYCAKVCPMKIGISDSFTAMNLYTLYKDLDKAKETLNRDITNKEKNMPSNCIKCGACEKVCPQHIHIRDNLVKVANTLE